MMAGHGVGTISEKNLSLAWARALVACHEAPGGCLCPASVRFVVPDNPDELEVESIRNLADGMLADPSRYIAGQSVVETVAGTIFPESVWMRSQKNRQAFYEIYGKMLPLIMRQHANRRGVYFQRLIKFNHGGGEAVNQLEFIINTWQQGNHRHSALQAAIFDPNTDHSHARRLGFPCLQQVVFHPLGTNGSGGLSVIAFYANQTLIEKGYGNYLGLVRLGKFMAEAMGLQLVEVVCMASALKYSDHRTKGECDGFVAQLKKELADAESR